MAVTDAPAQETPLTDDPAEWEDLEDFYEDLLPEEDWSDLFATLEKKKKKEK